VAALDQRGKVKLINDLKPELLPSFTVEEVQEFVTKMLRRHRVKFSAGAVERVLQLLGTPIPYFLQMLVQELHRNWKRNKARPVSAGTVSEVFNKTLLGEMARDKLQHYRTRIDVHYPPEEREAACYLLNKLSLSEHGISRSTLLHLYRQIEAKKSGARTGQTLDQAFQRLLLYLQSDFYVEETGDGEYDFGSLLLKTWWKKYYGYEAGGN
jgi:hypothetical protein